MVISGVSWEGLKLNLGSPFFVSSISRVLSNSLDGILIRRVVREGIYLTKGSLSTVRTGLAKIKNFIKLIQGAPSV